ncbi:hypothetical protein K2173_005868 [Erythroxylum novogranatense]|uniref:Uncharacterized protein n=1 Tax=Erythroxylum novogranatense TaxID=1862640 RepID=A0AAV8U2W5_9ROSI|nr:hypothetical protein K2173_005868 [Erythroxylum novogranatense]
MASESKQSVARVKPSNNPDGSSKVDSSVQSRKIDGSIKHPADSKFESAPTVPKTEVKSKSTPCSPKTKTTSKTTKVREKKVYSLPGQKYDPPDEREPLRIFYESLSKQIPSSEMAEFWMMEHGLLSPERAKKAHEKKQRKQKMQRMGTPIKSSKPPSKPESSQKQQLAPKNGEAKAKRKIINENDDDEFILSPKRKKP